MIILQENKCYETAFLSVIIQGDFLNVSSLLIILHFVKIQPVFIVDSF